MKGIQKQPLNKVQWIDRDQLKPNSYNPNKVMKPELELLKLSILEDGWTQPIVVNDDFTIVDGFHRWTVSGHKEIHEITEGKVPVVVLNPADHSQRMMATIRHNRARGTHGVLPMSDIVKDLIEQGLTGEEIMKRLKMEKEEVVRLLYRGGIPKSEVFKDEDFSQSWTPSAKS